MITSKEICQAMDKNQKCKIEGIKQKESKGRMSNWLRKVRIKIGFTNALVKLRPQTNLRLVLYDNML